MAWTFSAGERDRELAREFIDWVFTELADPPPGWEATVEEHQLIIVYRHVDSHWRKYPEPGELIPVGNYWLCLWCSFPKRWGARRCWWCDQQRGVVDAPDWAYGVGFQPEVEGAPGRPAAATAAAAAATTAAAAAADVDAADAASDVDAADAADHRDPEHLADGDDFARVMGLGS